MNNVLTCVYCGHEYPDGTPSAKHKLLTDHIRVCEKHPLRSAEEQIKKLVRALSALMGVTSKNDIVNMTIGIMSTPAPDEDKRAALEALDVLKDHL